jgi:type II secretory pathway pseudopilin PulG
MRISDVYDSVAIDQLEELHGYSGSVDLGMGDLGKSLFRKLAKYSPLRLAKKYDPLTKALIKYDPATRYLTKRVFTKKWFMKNSLYLSLAAQLLNFIVPGLGVLVALAISISSAALALSEAKKAKAMARKVETASDQASAADQAAADADANKALDAAYVKAGLYFTTTYGMTNDKWAALSVEGKNKFLNLVLFDQHASEIQKQNVTRDQFQAMSVGDEQGVLSKMAQNLPGSPGPFKEAPDDVIDIPVNAQGQAIGPVPTVAAFMGGGEWYTNPIIVGGGIVAVMALAAVSWKLWKNV